MTPGASPFPFPELIETELAGESGNFSCILSTTSYHRREEEKEEEKEGPTSISTKTPQIQTQQLTQIDSKTQINLRSVHSQTHHYRHHRYYNEGTSDLRHSSSGEEQRVEEEG